jgi:hypothetical protein
MTSTSRQPSPGPTELPAARAGAGRRILRALAGLVGGGALALLLTGCFSAPPQIISLEPNRGSTGVRADAPVRVVFDKAVLHASVVGRFTVSPAVPGCDLTAAFAASSTAACWIHWLDPQPGFELLHSGAVFAPLTQYSFTLVGGFADTQGARNGLDHHWDVTSAAAPRLAAISPGDRSVDVPVDAGLAVGFSAPMDAPTTAAAIHLDPMVPGTRVIRNDQDHSRFAILPGQMLVPGVAYAVVVDGSARGEDQQALAGPGGGHFTTGSRLGSAHGVVLAGAAGGNATEVLVPALAAAAPGEPIAAPVLARAPVCTASAGCGAVAAQAPLSTYETAAIAPDAAHVAVVVDDVVTGTSQLQVIDTVRGTVVVRVAGGVRPSWSPDSSAVALVTGSTVEVVSLASGLPAPVATGVGLTGPPLWTGPSTLVLSTAASAGAPAGIELVNLAAGARYTLPAATPGSVAVAVSPGGSRLAVAEASGAVLVVPAAGAAGGGQLLAGRVVAIGFTDEGTLLAISPDGSTLVRISVVGGDTSAISLSVGFAEISTVRVAPDGRRLVYIGTDAAGAAQAYVANADGSGATPCTRFVAGSGIEAVAVGFAA